MTGDNIRLYRSLGTANVEAVHNIGAHWPPSLTVMLYSSDDAPPTLQLMFNPGSEGHLVVISPVAGGL